MTEMPSDSQVVSSAPNNFNNMSLISSQTFSSTYVASFPVTGALKAYTFSIQGLDNIGENTVPAIVTIEHYDPRYGAVVQENVVIGGLPGPAYVTVLSGTVPYQNAMGLISITVSPLGDFTSLNMNDVAQGFGQKFADTLGGVTGALELVPLRLGHMHRSLRRRGSCGTRRV